MTSQPRDPSVRGCPERGDPISAHELRPIPKRRGGTGEALHNTRTNTTCWATLDRITDEMRAALRREDGR